MKARTYRILSRSRGLFSVLGIVGGGILSRILLLHISSVVVVVSVLLRERRESAQVASKI